MPDSQKDGEGNPFLLKTLTRIEDKLDVITDNGQDMQIRLTKIEERFSKIDSFEETKMDHESRITKTEVNVLNLATSVVDLNNAKGTNENRLTALETKGNMSAGIVSTIVSIVITVAMTILSHFLKGWGPN